MIRSAIIGVLGAALLLPYFGCGTRVGEVSQDSDTGSLRVSRAGVEGSEPAIAAGPDGRVHVAYVEKEGKDGMDLFVRSYDAERRELSPAVRVNPSAGDARTWYGDPPTIVSGADGKLYVGWTARYPGGAKGTILYLSVSSDGGASFAAPVRVNDDAEPASHGMHSMAVAPDGRIYFTWLDERYLHGKPQARAGSFTPMFAFFHHTPTPEPEIEPNAELYFAVSDDGGRSFGANRLVERDICPCCKTAIVVSPDGEIYIGYRKVFNGGFRHIAVSHALDAGADFGEPVQVSDDRWRIDACPVSGPALRLDGDALAVAWFSGGEGRQGVYVTRSADNAHTFAPRTLVDATQALGAITWTGNSLIYSADGALRSAQPNSAESISLREARNPAATQSGGSVYYAFVSTSEEKKSVWLDVSR